MSAAAALALAQLLEQLLPVGISVYNQIRNDLDAKTLASVEELLAKADALYAAIGTTADAEIAKNTPKQ